MLYGIYVIMEDLILKNYTAREVDYRVGHFLYPEKHWDFVRADGFVRPYLSLYAALWNTPQATEVLHTHHILHSYAVPAIASWGILTNTLTLLVLLCSQARKLSGMQYVAALIASDLVFMLVVLLVWIADLPTHHERFYTLAGWCQFISYGSHICTFLHVWCTVALCVDRFIYVMFTEASKRLCTPLKAKAVLSALILLAVVIYLNTSLLERRKDFFYKHVCTEMKPFITIIIILRMLEVAFNIILPYTVLAAGSGIIIGRLLWPRPPVATRTSTHNKQQKDVTRISLVYSMVLLLLTGPAQGLRVYHIYQSAQKERPILSPTQLQMENILLLIFYFRGIIHFALLSASCSVFQQSLRTLFCKKNTSSNHESPESEVPLTVTRGSNA